MVLIRGGMVKLVNTADLKSAAVRLPGSIPGVPTIQSTRHSVNPASIQNGMTGMRLWVDLQSHGLILFYKNVIF